MTAGYLTALANRALGGAPELQPPVPSRFEPEGPRAELAEFIRISDSEAPPDDAGIVAEKRPAPITEPGQRLRGAYEPDTVSEGPAQSPAHGNWPALDARHNPAEPRAEARRVPRLPAEIPDDARSSYERLTSHAAAGGTGLLLPGAAADMAAAAPAADAAIPSGESTGRRDAAEIAQGGQRAGDNRRDIARQQPAGSEPAVVVHIGRVEVRAVQAPRPPAAAPRSRPPAEPSLADYLLARDRGRQ